MSNKSIISTIINELLNHHVTDIRSEITTNKDLLESLINQVRELEEKLSTMDQLPAEIETFLQSYKEMLVQNFILLIRQEEICDKQVEVNKFLQDSFNSTGEVPKQQTEEGLQLQEELYVLREMRNFYLENNDLEACSEVVSRIRQIRREMKKEGM